MCGFAAAGFALGAVGTLSDISNSNKQADQQDANNAANLRREEISYTLRTEDRVKRRKQVMATQQSMFSSRGIQTAGSVINVLANTSEQFAKEQYQDAINIQAVREGASISAESIALENTSNIANSLFDLGGSTIDYLQAL